MDKDYLILDFGMVLAGPATDNWFITPNFYKVVNRDKVKLEEFKKAIKKYGYYLDMPMKNEAEEFVCFSEFYRHILEDMEYPVTDDIVEELADDWTFNDNKYKFYPNVIEELEYLSKSHKLLVLSDNWPSVLRIMHNNDTYKYFERIYVSSIYGCLKKQGTFFDYPIQDYDLKNKKTIFVDDDLKNLDVSLKKGLTPIMMDRTNDVVKTKYKKINSLYNIK